MKVPVKLVQKPGAFTREEQAIMRYHPVDGAWMILESDNRLDLCAAVAFEQTAPVRDRGPGPLPSGLSKC